MTQLFFLFYILPGYGLTLDALTTGVLALGLHYSSYTAEVYRSGIQGVPRGQWEAATALNFSPVQTWRRVILPQAIPPVIPALGNYLIGMFKDTPLLATITVLELLGTALTEAGRTFRYLEPITLVGLIFLAAEPAFGRVRAASWIGASPDRDRRNRDSRGHESARVRFRGVSKSFGTLEVIRGIDLDVPGGQKVAVIGPSGSGKTTLLRLIMTLERPEKGTIEIEGELLGLRREKGRLAPDSDRHLRQVRGKIGMVFQHFNLFPHMTALQNVMVGPVQVLRMPKGEASERAVDLLKLVGLADKATAYPRQLSGGQQQRVAIARALAMRPRRSCCSTKSRRPSIPS